MMVPSHSCRSMNSRTNCFSSGVVAMLKAKSLVVSFSISSSVSPLSCISFSRFLTLISYCQQ